MRVGEVMMLQAFGRRQGSRHHRKENKNTTKVQDFITNNPNPTFAEVWRDIVEEQKRK